MPPAPPRGCTHHRHLTRKGALREAPCLRHDALTGAIQYLDAQVDDARHTMTVVRTAATFGALAASRVKVTGFLREGERVTGARSPTWRPASQFEVRAKQVINATGVWTDDTQALADTRGQFHVRASKGIHLVVPRDRLQSNTGIILRTEKSVLFVIPWGRHWIIGTTDTDWSLSKEHPAASSRDIDYLLEHVNSVLSSPLTREDVEGVYAGLRPLLAGESESTSKLSREHVVGHPVPGLVVVAGGKYTTYRVMAKDAVDEAARTMDARVPDVGHGRPAAGRRRGLPGAVEPAPVARGRPPASTSPGSSTCSTATARCINELLDMIRADPSLAEPLPGADDYLAVEARYAVTHEGARHLDDVLARRTRISIEAWDRGVAAAPKVADLMADVLGWDDAEKKREVDPYLGRVAAERKSQTEPDDDTAEAARLDTLDIAVPSQPRAHPARPTREGRRTPQGRRAQPGRPIQSAQRQSRASSPAAAIAVARCETPMRAAGDSVHADQAVGSSVRVTASRHARLRRHGL